VKRVTAIAPGRFAALLLPGVKAKAPTKRVIRYPVEPALSPAMSASPPKAEIISEQRLHRDAPRRIDRIAVDATCAYRPPTNPADYRRII
jgi:hypothetical protein